MDWKDPAAVKAYRAKYYADNREARLECAAAYRAEHLEAIRESGRRRCANLTEAQREVWRGYKANWHANLTEAQREDRRERQRNRRANLTEDQREATRANLKAYRAEHREELRAKKAKHWAYLRATFFEMYGRVCALCHCNDLVVLTQDHVQGGGRAEDSKVAYQRAISEYRPDLFRALCCNCQWLAFRAHQRFIGLDEAAQEKLRAWAATPQGLRWAALRTKFFAMYGSACKLCGYDNPIALSLDHYNGNGAGEETDASYRRATKAYNPREFRVLCFNCNFKEFRAWQRHIGKDKPDLDPLCLDPLAFE